MNIGIIGLGSIAHRFARVLNTSEKYQLVAVAARDQSRAVDFAARFGAKKAYDRYLDLIEDPEVDGIYIALTHNFHYDVARTCLEHGKAVLCEKPLAVTRQEADALVALAREKNVLLMEAMWTRSLPAFKKALSWVREGRIGAVRLIQASFCFDFPYDPNHRLYNPDLAGGSLLDAGVYPIEFALGMTEQAPDQVKGLMHLCPTGADDFVAMTLSFPQGTLASLSCGLTARTSSDAYLYGSEGSICVRDFLRTRQCERYDRDNNLVERFEAEDVDGFIYQIEHFSDLFETGKIESPLIPWQDTQACATIFDILRA